MSSKTDLELRVIIAKKFKAQRIKSNFTQEDAAYGVGLSRVAISNCEIGNHGFTIDVLFKAAFLFNCLITDLIPSFEEYKPKLKNRSNAAEKRKEKQIASLEKKIQLLKGEL